MIITSCDNSGNQQVKMRRPGLLSLLFLSSWKTYKASDSLTFLDLGSQAATSLPPKVSQSWFLECEKEGRLRFKVQVTSLENAEIKPGQRQGGLGTAVELRDWLELELG